MIGLILAVILTAAPTPDCEVAHTIEAGDRAPCGGVLLPPVEHAELEQARAKLEAAEARAARAEELLDATERAFVAFREESERALKACEAGKVCPPPPKPEQPGLFARPEFAWPMGLLVGFVGGMVFDSEVIQRR